ncbi:MAG TPA: M48 family metallopeptidase [Verrucomicrobiales bacterium]|nr:M48 family metallopeptidase [Verrucomicrobiales bacterium]
MTAWPDNAQNTRNWPATAYQNTLPNGQAHGRISADGGDLIFSAGGVPPLRLPLDGIDIRYGGFNSQQAFLSHPQLPEWTFLCADPGFLKDDAIRLHPVHGKGAKRKNRAAKKWPWPVKAMIFMTVLFIAGISALWIYRAAITDAIASKIPVSTEKQLGEAVYAQVKATTKEVTDPEMVAKLKAVTDRLVPAVKDTRYEFKFHIVENDTINAFAVPGGHIVVHTALIKKAKRPEEIAGVLAHEISHITRRHSLRNMVSSLGTMVIIQAVFGDYSALADGASNLLGQKYSRDFETEADATGWKYLLAAKIDPQGIIDFFQTLRDEEKKTGMDTSGALELLSTHPATEGRMAALTELKKEIPAGTTFDPILPVAAEKTPEPAKPAANP